MRYAAVDVALLLCARVAAQLIFVYARTKLYRMIKHFSQRTFVAFKVYIGGEMCECVRKRAHNISEIDLQLRCWRRQREFNNRTLHIFWINARIYSIYKFPQVLCTTHTHTHILLLGLCTSISVYSYYMHEWYVSKMCVVYVQYAVYSFLANIVRFHRFPFSRTNICGGCGLVGAEIHLSKYKNNVNMHARSCWSLTYARV